MGIFGKLFGGGNKGGGDRIQNLMGTLKTDLNLTEDQAKKIQQSFMDFRQERKDLKSSGGDKSQLQGARQDLKQNILSVLNDQQKQTFIANAAKYDELMHPNKT